MIFLGLGAQAPKYLGIPGEKGPGVIAGIGYLRQHKDLDEIELGAQVLVIGGGNTAIDAARSARRDGARVTLVYRRGESEMPAARQEIDDARQEAGDPFASVFDRSEVSDTLLSSDDPLRELAPAIPQHNNIEAEATQTSQPMLLLGIPVRKLALVLLAGLILLAAIIHRRRTGDLHEMQ